MRRPLHKLAGLALAFALAGADWSHPIKNQLAMNLADRKSMNTHIHLLESFTTLYEVTHDAKVKARVPGSGSKVGNPGTEVNQEAFRRVSSTLVWCV